jgi:LPXTG-motif cell wall-anchored protein
MPKAARENRSQYAECRCPEKARQVSAPEHNQRRRQFMKYARSGILMLLLAFAPPLMCAQQAGSAQSSATPTPPMGVRILEPRAGQKLNHNFVVVEFEPGSPLQTTSGTPRFQIQLDDRAPVTTNFNQTTFTGLQPGPHTVTVQAIDANGTPIVGSQNVVQFIVIPTITPGTEGPHSQSEPSGKLASRMKPVLWNGAAGTETNAQTTAAQGSSDEGLPDTGSALPLLSIIGFGVLMGGIFSARRTR